MKKIDWNKKLEWVFGLESDTISRTEPKYITTTSIEGHVRHLVAFTLVYTDSLRNPFFHVQVLDDYGRVSSDTVQVVRNKEPKTVTYTIGYNVYAPAKGSCGLNTYFWDTYEEAEKAINKCGKYLETRSITWTEVEE